MTDGTDSTAQERTWATLCHVAAFSALIGIPFGNVLGPLVVWLIKRQESPLVDDQGRESVNFQISLTLALLIPVFVILVGLIASETAGAALAAFLLALVVLAAIGIYGLVAVVIAAIRTNEGARYRYPLSVRFLK